MKKILFYLFILISLVSCSKDVQPKPSGELRLEYPKPIYQEFTGSSSYSFQYSNFATITNAKKPNWFYLNYPKMKATIYLSYKPVTNNINLLLKDAQKLTYEHVIKADDILEQPFINKKDKVYGMFYTVDGNAATNAQFYATDSIKHFVTGSVYFYAKPNFDSIMPAADYIRNDMQTLMETLKWK